MKKSSILILVVITLFSVTDAEAKYSGGSGDPNDPYRIATAEDLNDIGNHIEDWNDCFILTDDINLSAFTGTQFNIIGPNYTTPFSGTFDGNGHTISNFTYDSNNAQRIGVFGHVVSSAEIRNVTMENVNINDGAGEALGSLVGINDGTISNCRVECAISGDNGIGGLVGLNIHGTISGCSAKGSVSGNVYVGGLTAWNDGVILYSYSDCYVSHGNYLGGLVGFSFNSTISNCYSTGAVDGNTYVGGLIGNSDLGTIFNCYTTAMVDGNGFVGSLAGESVDGYFTACFWNEDINPDVNGFGTGNTSDPNVIGRSTAEMKNQSTFTDVGWDFVEVWDIGENQTYPFLRTHLPSDINKDNETDFYDFAILAEHWLQSKSI